MPSLSLLCRHYLYYAVTISTKRALLCRLTQSTKRFSGKDFFVNSTTLADTESSVIHTPAPLSERTPELESAKKSTH